jgi:hypothetical protein
VGTALAICGALAMAGIALGATSTKVTIEAQVGGFLGYAQSPEKDLCELNRKVKPYKQKGDHQERGVVELVGSGEGLLHVGQLLALLRSP